MTQWRKSQKHDVLLLAEIQKFRFRQIWMGFHLDHGRLDSRGFVDGHEPFQGDVRQSDGPASAMVHQTLYRLPGLDHSHAAVVQDISVLIPRILIVPRLKRKRSVT